MKHNRWFQMFAIFIAASMMLTACATTTTLTVAPTVTPIPIAKLAPPTATPIPTATLAPATATPIPTATLAPATATTVPTATLAPATATTVPTATLALATDIANPGILAPDSQVQGHTYGEWSAIAWSSMFAIPAAENPGRGEPWTDCSVERSGNVGVGVIFFAPYGPFTCTMPSGTMLFLDVATSECSTLEQPPFYGGNEEELRACALSFVHTNMQVTIDGVAVQNLSDYTVLSPMYQFTVPDGNIFKVPAGTVGESVSYGTFLMLAPLDPGQHTIYIHAELPKINSSIDQTFNITVTH